MFKVNSENRAVMYRQENPKTGAPRYVCYANIDGKEMRFPLFAGVTDDEKIYWSGPVEENEVPYVPK
jgi:hypothetical protein